METLPELDAPSHIWGSKYDMFKDVLSAQSNKSHLNPNNVLDVTDMSWRRKDGHSSIYYLNPSASFYKQDCSHWCLPGVPDSWNELLYALFLKRDANSSALSK